MQEITHFFLTPYYKTPIYLIVLEVIAMILGVASVIYAKKENKLVFPLGFLSTSIYIYILYYYEIFGDLTINIYYSIMGIYGWYMWKKITGNKENIPISKTNKKEKIIATAIFVFALIFIFVVYLKTNKIPNNLNFNQSLNAIYLNLTSGSLDKFKLVVPYIDTFTTATAFVAMWLMTQKKIEHWSFWVFTNLLSIPLYFVKGLGFTAIQYSVFLVLAILGYLQWKKILDNKKQPF